MLFHAGRYQEALEWARRANHSPNPRQNSFGIAVAALIKLGRQEEAAVALADLLEHAPTSSLSEIRNKFDWWFPGSAEANRHIIEALREAGLPK